MRLKSKNHFWIMRETSYYFLNHNEERVYIFIQEA